MWVGRVFNWVESTKLSQSCNSTLHLWRSMMGGWGIISPLSKFTTTHGLFPHPDRPPPFWTASPSWAASPSWTAHGANGDRSLDGSRARVFHRKTCFSIQRTRRAKRWTYRHSGGYDIGEGWTVQGRSGCTREQEGGSCMAYYRHKSDHERMFETEEVSDRMRLRWLWWAGSNFRRNRCALFDGDNQRQVSLFIDFQQQQQQQQQGQQQQGQQQGQLE